MTKNEIQKIADAKAVRVWNFFRAKYPTLPVLSPVIVLNGRYTKCAGACVTEDRVIQLGTRFYIKFPEIMTDIIIPHEICHQIDFDLNGWYTRKPHHGKPWQILMLQYGIPADPYHTMEL